MVSAIRTGTAQGAFATALMTVTAQTVLGLSVVLASTIFRATAAVVTLVQVVTTPISFLPAAKYASPLVPSVLTVLPTAWPAKPSTESSSTNTSTPTAPSAAAAHAPPKPTPTPPTTASPVTPPSPSALPAPCTLPTVLPASLASIWLDPSRTATAPTSPASVPALMLITTK